MLNFDKICYNLIGTTQPNSLSDTPLRNRTNFATKIDSWPLYFRCLEEIAANPFTKNKNVLSWNDLSRLLTHGLLLISFEQLEKVSFMNKNGLKQIKNRFFENHKINISTRVLLQVYVVVNDGFLLVYNSLLVVAL